MTVFAPGDPRRGDESEPGELPWHESFGALALCIYEPAFATLELDAVRWRAGSDAPPLKVETYLRTFTGNSNPFMSRHGHPLDPKPWPGEWSEEIAGTEIVQPCDEAKPGSPDLTELVIVLTADADGAHIEEVMIDYTATGRRYTLIITHDMVLCGEKVDDDDC